MPAAQRRVADSGADYYPTPAWATHALIDNETFEGTIWEPACGDGAMSEVLKTTGAMVSSSDLFDRGYGTTGVDFLTRSPLYPDNIVTNPPYCLAEDFLKVALAQAQHKVALLLRLAFLEGARRHRSLYSVHPPSRVWVFTERITMYPGGVNTYAWDVNPNGEARGGNGTTAYAWFVWDKKSSGGTELLWLPPGYRAKYK